jgi:hypothetical protein
MRDSHITCTVEAVEQILHHSRARGSRLEDYDCWLGRVEKTR